MPNLPKKGGERKVKSYAREIKIKDSKWLYTNFPGEKSEYIKVSNNKISITKEMRHGLYIDLDKKGNVVGVEIIR